VTKAKPTARPSVPVSRRALFQRVSRKLARDEGERLLTCREDSRAFQQMGRYYTVDGKRNTVTRRDVDLEALAHEIKAIAPWEYLTDTK